MNKNPIRKQYDINETSFREITQYHDVINHRNDVMSVRVMFGLHVQLDETMVLKKQVSYLIFKPEIPISEWHNLQSSIKISCYT